jgi:hypothetical protein
MICEATGEEDALSDSGPLRPALEEEVYEEEALSKASLDV